MNDIHKILLDTMEWYPISKNDTGIKIVRRDLAVPKIIEYFSQASKNKRKMKKIIVAIRAFFCLDGFNAYNV